MSGDVLVVNDTKVIPAHLIARRKTGGTVEILLLRAEPAHPELWQAMAMPLRKLKPAEKLWLGDSDTDCLTVEDIISGADGQKRVLLNLGTQSNVYRILTQYGTAPLPPYIHRKDALGANDRSADLERYQTIFARTPGAVAAPTAGLHFSELLFERLRKRGIEVCTITLHVGPGTFKPITTTIEDHSIEAEQFSISEETADAVNRATKENRRVIAVGTTTCRALETAGGPDGTVQAVSQGSSNLYIRPGSQFRVISGLITNFHLSRSSLLVLVCAFGGYDLIMGAYKTAVQERYRFFSYGDAMLIT